MSRIERRLAISFALGVCLNGVAAAQRADSLFLLGAVGGTIWNNPSTTSYMSDMHEMGGNWAAVAAWVFPNEQVMYDRLHEAETLGIRIVLSDAKLWGDSADMMVS